MALVNAGKKRTDGFTSMVEDPRVESCANME